MGCHRYGCCGDGCYPRREALRVEGGTGSAHQRRYDCQRCLGAAHYRTAPAHERGTGAVAVPDLSGQADRGVGVDVVDSGQRPLGRSAFRRAVNEIAGLRDHAVTAVAKGTTRPLFPIWPGGGQRLKPALLSAWQRRPPAITHSAGSTAGTPPAQVIGPYG